MNALTTLFLAILACSSIELASSVQFFEFPEGSLERLLFELDTYDFPRFNLILNEEDAHDLFNQEDIFASDAFDYLGEAAFDGENNEVSLDDLIPPSEEVLEVLTFVDLINKKDYDIDSLFEDNGFFQAPEVQSEHNCDNFNEELASALFDVKSGEEQLNMMLSALVLNVVNNMEENGETETALFELPLALSGVAAAAADGFNGIDGEQEKGEENLDAKYNFILEGRNKHAEASSLNLYLTIGCVIVALLVIGATVVGVKDLRKHEETLEEATSSDYFELSY